MKQKMDKNQWDAISEELKKKLGVLQQRVRALKIPVIVVFEGWDSAGKGSMISRMITNLDPRGFSVYSINAPSTDEQRYPWMRRYWQKVPDYGDIAIFDRSWYQEVAIYDEQRMTAQQRDSRYEEIEDFEQQLTDDGYVLLKFFLHISKKEQGRRLKVLESKKETRWRVTKADWKQHERYSHYLSVFDSMIEHTDHLNAKWTIVEADDKRFATYKVFSALINAMQREIERREAPAPQPSSPVIRVSADIVPQQIPLLTQINPQQEMEDKEYKAELKFCQQRLSDLHNVLYQKKIPMILAYEGWDAAGKGGNIKRVTQALDPRGYEVIPIAAPTTVEKNHPHLWRFWEALPRDGHIAVFDRTWYGRVMVERIEGFCTEEQWARAYDEINRFEKDLHEWGAIVQKFWLQIDKDEQLRRFTERQDTPEKQYKITDEDWRNREKWEAYEVAVNELLQRTNTKYAPWTIVESNNKQYARIKTMRKIIAAIEERV